MFDILKGINQSNVTGYEVLVSSQKVELNPFDSLVLEHYQDTFKQNRFVLKKRLTGEVIAAIMFDRENICAFRETKEEERRKGYQTNLWAFAAITLGNIKHSEHLTKDGEKLI